MYQRLSIFFTIVSFAAVVESVRIFTSSAPYITENRKELVPVAITLTGIFIFLAILFWRKAFPSNNNKHEE